MKKLYRKLFIILIVFLIVNGFLLYLPLNSLLHYWLNILILLIFMITLIVFLKIAILNPLQEINQSLLLFQQTGSGRISVNRPHTFKEIGEIVANIENVFTRLHKKTIEISEAKEFLETTIFKSKISHSLPKPFKIEQLAYQVNRLLGGNNV